MRPSAGRFLVGVGRRLSSRADFKRDSSSLLGRRDLVETLTCGEAVMKLLADYEVDTVFGMAGTMTIELYRGIARAGIRHVQCRNEQGASLMAGGHTRSSGTPRVW